MKINKFEKFIEKKILNRGLDYYKSEDILEFEKVSQSLFKGLIRGTSLYNTTIEIDKSLEIINASCDCPYSYGGYCKHQVALMYMINDLNAYSLAYKSSGNMSIIKELTAKMTKKELVELIRKMCIFDRNSLNQLLILLDIDDDLYEEATQYYE